jgi:hypothetical protein
MTEDRKKLQHHLGRLRGVQHQIDEARRKLHERASQQLASIPAVQQHVEDHVARGLGGGPLAQRALRKLLIERARLHHVVLGADGAGDDAGA